MIGENKERKNNFVLAYSIDVTSIPLIAVVCIKFLVNITLILLEQISVLILTDSQHKIRLLTVFSIYGKKSYFTQRTKMRAHSS